MFCRTLLTVLMSLIPVAGQTQEHVRTILAPTDGEFVEYMGISVALDDAGRAVTNLRYEDSRARLLAAVDLESGNVTKATYQSQGTRTFKDAWRLIGQDDRLLVCGDARDNRDGPRRSLMVDTATHAILARFNDPSAGAESNDFADACALNGDLVAISASRKDDVRFSQAGMVHFFDANTGAHLHTLTEADATGDGLGTFGRAIAMDDRFIAISTTGAHITRGYFGHVDLYDRETFAHVHRFERPPNGIPHNDGVFGAELLMGDGRLFIGSTYDTQKRERQSGKVWAYDLESFDELYRLISPLDHKNHRFGGTLALHKGRLFVSQSDAEVAGVSEAGAVFIYDAASGDLTGGLVAPDPSHDVLFGRSVAVSDHGILIGASRVRHDQGMGAVYFYR